MHTCRILAVGFVVFANAELSVAAPKAKKDPRLAAFERAADVLFKQLDKDNNKKLTQAELKKGQKLFSARMEKFADGGLIGDNGPAIFEGQAPDLQGNDAITADEFRQYFLAQTQIADQEVRQRNIARAQAAAAQRTFRGRDRDDDESDRDRERDRDRDRDRDRGSREEKTGSDGPSRESKTDKRDK